jgi:small subunit ribosomal protein S3
MSKEEVNKGKKVNSARLSCWCHQRLGFPLVANKAAFGDTLVEDYNVRKFIKKSLYAAGVPRIEIEKICRQG